MKWTKYTYTFLLLVLSTIALTQDIPPKPNPPRLVNDYTGTLTADQQQALERKLVAFDDSTSTQISVVIVPTLNGEDVADYALELGRKWGIGGKENNNGVILLIAKKDRKLNISPGYGLEGALTDVTAKHIIDDVIVPSFKGEDYYRGIEEGTDVIIKAVTGKYKAPANYRKKNRPFGIGKIIILIIIIIIFSAFGSRGGGGSFMSRRGTRGISGPILWGSFLGGGSSGGGGSSSGGFGGFGGGSFGGGGASGSW